MPAKQYKNFCFTLNNWTAEEYAHIQTAECKYLIIGKEIGEDNKTPHLQGYIQMHKKATFYKMKQVLGNRAHIEQAQGNAEQNIKYCSKFDSNPLVIGEPRQRANFVLRELCHDIRDMKISGDEVFYADPEFWERHSKAIGKAQQDADAKQARSGFDRAIWLWGPAGTGKSHMLFEWLLKGKDYYRLPDDNSWFDGYRGQEFIAINEFRGHIKYAELLSICDKWPHDFRRRGLAPQPCLARTVIITSSRPPEEVYRTVAQHDPMDQIYRRFEVYHVEHKYGNLKRYFPDFPTSNVPPQDWSWATHDPNVMRQEPMDQKEELVTPETRPDLFDEDGEPNGRFFEEMGHEEDEQPDQIFYDFIGSNGNYPHLK